MAKVAEMPTEKAKVLLHQTIEACLLESPVEQRLKNVNVCIRRLQDYGDGISKELHELKKIAGILSCYQENPSPERELELTERLLTLYVSVSGGALIF